MGEAGKIPLSNGMSKVAVISYAEGDCVIRVLPKNDDRNSAAEWRTVNTPDRLEDYVVGVAAAALPESGFLVVEKNDEIIACIWVHHLGNECDLNVAGTLVLDQVETIDPKNTIPIVSRLLHKWCQCLVDAKAVSNVEIGI